MNHRSRVWPLQEAKAKFSELVRLTQTEGPQTVTIHGAPAVIVSAYSPEKKLIAGKFEPTGTGIDLIRMMQSCPVPEFEIPERPTDSAPRSEVEFE
jgi:prevent-host-death family protein